ncbi:uncharacterized protein DNG_04507 [Cephalotrichum gorgonifer]|uniref:Uncharacterized protein n=1 Tax=Cephalotrichum gorgonifer TaxID=2041049 RepID=A0AAE8MY46_9PEZI|nr:uncharacterized protein DNG_04507 [Cephalotrichum gorgonifer]
MRFNLISSLLLGSVPSIVSALGIDADDIPRACAARCAPLVQLSRACDVNDDIVGDAQEELLELQCICGNTDIAVADVTVDCAVCVGDNAFDREDLEDIQEIILACGF